MNQTLRNVLTGRRLKIAVAVVFVYGLIGFFVVPAIVRWYVPRYVQKDLHCQAAIGKVRINPFLLTFAIDDFSLRQADGAPLAAFRHFIVDVETSSLFHWALVLRELHVDRPEVHLVLESDGTLNLEKLVPPSPEKPEPAKPDRKPFRFILRDFAIRDGHIAVVDKRQSSPAAADLTKLNIHLKNLSTVKGYDGTYQLAAATEKGESLQWEGDISLAPLRSDGKLTLKAIRVAGLWEFFRDQTNLEQPAGLIDVTAGYHLDALKAPLNLVVKDLNISLSDLALKLAKAEKPLLNLKKADLDVSRFDLAAKELQVRKLLVMDGDADIRIDGAGALNLQRIVRETAKDSGKGKQAAEPQPPSGKSEGAAAAAPPASAPVAASAADSHAQPSEASPKTEAAGPPPAPVAATPVATPVPDAGETPFKVKVDAVEFKNIAAALDDQSRKMKAAIGGIDFGFNAEAELGAPGNKVTVRQIAAQLRKIDVQGQEKPAPVFAAEQLALEGGEWDLDARSLTIDRISLDNGRIDAGRDAEGRINWLALAGTGAGGGNPPQESGPPKSGPGWKFLIKSFAIANFSSDFSDLTTPSDKPVLNVRNITSTVGNIDGKSPMDLKIAFQLQQGGSAAVSGTVNPSAPSVDAKLTVKDLVLTSLQPYLEPFVTLKLQSAALSTNGTFHFGLPGDKQVSYEGDFGLTKLSLIEPGVKKPYLSLDAMRIPHFKLGLQPNGFEADEIKIVKPVGEFIIAEDKTLNLTKVVKKQNEKKQKPVHPVEKKSKKDQDAFPYKIAKIQVENGNVVFADFSLRPKFMTRMHDLKGTVTGLSSAKESQARIKLDGRVDRYGLAKINGVIRPSDFKRYSDVEMIFRNVEMKNLSPYSGKFAGRLIKSGKLSADFKYKIQDNKMVGDNKVIVDNLTLGEHVDNPDASNLPLDLAIAILKDSDGRIDIGLPVSGDLDDPQFSIGPLIWKAFANLITKAVTAPFRALGSLLGGDTEQFKAVEFDPGSAELSPPEKEKLVKLADALTKRPELKLVVQGRYSLEIDGNELKERSVRRAVLAAMGKKIGPKEDPDPLDFTDSTTRHTLEDLYRKRFGKSSLDELAEGIEKGTITPRIPEEHKEKKEGDSGFFSNVFNGMKLYKLIPGARSPEQAALWAGELYLRLVESEKIPDQAFTQLATERANAIVDDLVKETQTPKDRIGTKDPEPLTGDEKPSATFSLDAI